MIPFDQGYNRRHGIQEADWTPIEPELWMQHPKEITKSTNEKSTEESLEDMDSTTTTPAATTTSTADQTAYVPLHDPRNQLTSLIKNARTNEDALKQRNQRVKQSQNRSRREYGW